METAPNHSHPDPRTSAPETAPENQAPADTNPAEGKGASSCAAQDQSRDEAIEVETEMATGNSAESSSADGTAETPEGLTLEQVAALLLGDHAHTPGNMDKVEQQTTDSDVFRLHQPFPINQRVERTLCSELVEIECTAAAELRVTANLEEIWQSGATLETESCLPENESIVLVRGDVRLAGRVLYCQPTITGYSIGIQFQPHSYWRPSLFMPAHALSLRTSVEIQREETAADAPSETQGTLGPEERLERDLLLELPSSVRGSRSTSASHSSNEHHELDKAPHTLGPDGDTQIASREPESSGNANPTDVQHAQRRTEAGQAPSRLRITLDDLSPLITRGSLIKLRSQMTVR